jgi:hypothetical protein
MTPFLVNILEVAGVIIGGASALALVFATIKSKLPQSTINMQNASIAALERQNTMLKEDIAASVVERTKQYNELMAIVTKLQARVEILETIPLGTMADSMKELALIMAELRDMGKTNQALIRGISVQAAPTGQSTITINK